MQPIQRKPNEDIVVTEEFMMDDNEMDSDDVKLFSKNLMKMSNSSVAKKIAESVNQDRKKLKFIKLAKDVIEQYDKKKKKEKGKLKIIFWIILQSASDILGNLDEENMNLIVDLLKKFTYDDVYLCEEMLNFLSDKIKKLTLRRKVAKRMIKIATFFFSMMSQKSR